MTERDPLDSLLSEWKPPEPSASMDAGVLQKYRQQREPGSGCSSALARFWTMRISVPAPLLLLTAVAIAALLIWVRTSFAPKSRASAPGIVTHLDSTGFQPLPNGAARVISGKDLGK